VSPDRTLQSLGRENFAERWKAPSPTLPRGKEQSIEPILGAHVGHHKLTADS